MAPTISHGQQPYPFLAGESPTLYCTLPSGEDAGNPPATLTFRDHATSQGQDGVSMTLPKFTKDNNGMRVVCEATNSFTDHGSNTPVTGDKVLEVYCE